MSLVDFMQQLQEQDNLVYSEVPEPSIRVIPPEKSCTKIIPPESIAAKPPTTIKLKIKQKAVPIEPDVDNKNDVQVVQPEPILKKPPNSSTVQVQQNTVPEIQNTKESSHTQQVPQIQQPVQQTVNKKPSDEELFINSGTESSKRNIWLEYYQKAKSSRKVNPIVERMRIGRFTITPDNKVLLLPDYDIVGKDPDAVLKDKWF